MKNINWDLWKKNLIWIFLLNILELESNLFISCLFRTFTSNRFSFNSSDF